MMTDGQKRERLSALFGVPVEHVTLPPDFEYLDLFGSRRPHAKAYKLHELEAMQDAAFIVEGWVPSGLTVVYAMPKHGKTFWVLTAAICFAMGIDFFGLKTTGPGRVLYIAAEGSGKALERRVRRIAKSLSVDYAELEQRMEFVTWGVKLDHEQSVNDLLLLNPGKWDMIVVDTLARCMGGDENDTASMNDAVAGIDRVRREAGAASAIVLHHRGWKERRLRGALALFGALDGLIFIERGKDNVNRVMVEELREAALPDDNVMAFKLDKEEGCFVLVEGATPKARLDEREAKMWEVLDRLYRDGGGPVAPKTWTEALDLLVPDLIEAGRAGKKPISDEGRRSQWRRSMTTMAKSGSILIDANDGTITPHYPSDDFGRDDDVVD